MELVYMISNTALLYKKTWIIKYGSGITKYCTSLQQTNHRNLCSGRPPSSVLNFLTVLPSRHLRIIYGTLLCIHVWLKVCVCLWERGSLVCRPQIYRALTLAEESTFSSPARNTDKRNGFHAVLSFILASHSFPLMYFNVSLLVLLSRSLHIPPCAHSFLSVFAAFCFHFFCPLFLAWNRSVQQCCKWTKKWKL